MTALRLLIVGLLAGLLTVSCVQPGKSTAAPGPLILVSIDSFRWDYLQKYDAPTLKALAARGVHATRLVPAFPTKTFPNHYTLVTGRRPEHHGVVSNYYYDPDLQASFNKALPADNADPRWWSQGEPVWITAEKQGVRAGTYAWPGSEASFGGRQVTKHQAYPGKIVSAQAVDTVLAWLDLPAESRPRFCALYLDHLDVVAHRVGPDSPETAAAVKEVDDAIARLLAGLAARGLGDTANVVVVSDHGMSEQSADRVVFIEDLVNLSEVQVESLGPNGGVRPKPGARPAAVIAAEMRTKVPPQVEVYLREEIPERLHYRDNPRIPPIVFIAADHWNVESKVGWAKIAGTLNRGNHGWDPATPNMGALFVAAGPAFRAHAAIGEVENIHLYTLLCRMLGIQPAPNDGDDRLARAALRP